MAPDSKLPERRGSRVRLLLELALRDLWFDQKVSLCIVASLVAVFTPLLLLFGLKFGVVSQMRDQLLNDPFTLELRMQGNGQFDRTWMEQLAAQPSAGFVIPLTRSLNTEADLMRTRQHFIEGVEVLPTAVGDPLLRSRIAPPTAQNEVVLSTSAAQRLGAAIGDQITLLVQRKRDGAFEQGRMALDVSGILDAAAYGRPAALVTLDLLVAMEDFRDGRRVESLGVSTGEPAAAERNSFARARIYARSTDGVAPLATWLETQRVSVTTRLREIESVQAVDRVLTLIFAVIAWTAILGSIASLIGAFLANIERKRRDLATLRLLGFGGAGVCAYVVIQAAALTSVACALGLGMYAVGSGIFNRALGRNLVGDAFVCRLEPEHVLIGCAAALLVAMLVAAIGSLRAVRIQPAESLRHG